MGEDPDRIREEIVQTRLEMGETVDALGYKADVKARAKDRVVGVKDRVVGATPDGGDVKQQARRAKSVAEENPLGLAVGAVAVGFLAGMLIPSTRVEDERMGALSDDVIARREDWSARTDAPAAPLPAQAPGKGLYTEPHERGA